VKNLLYLTHRIPYPPNKGDKIRSYHLLRGLVKRWNVHLGTFIDDAGDWQYVPLLEEMCAETKFIALNQTMAKLKALRGLLNGTSLTTRYYESNVMKNWVNEIANKKDIDCVVAYSSSMAQYASPLIGQGIRTVVDFCDMDSDKWRQYSERVVGIKRRVYRRESNKLCQEEAAIAAQCDASVLISEDEATFFCAQTGTPSTNVHTVHNGVDVAYFDPALTYADPFKKDCQAIVFVGAMDYWPNIDWFAEEIFPSVKARSPDAVFYVVGSNPGQEVLKLKLRPGVTVTGRVEDVRPYLKFARCVVAPLRVARGVQNKVLEAMAMARPVVATTAAFEGITSDRGSGTRICDTNESWIDELLSVLRDRELVGNAMGARRHVTEHYSWEASAQILANVVSGI